MVIVSESISFVVVASALILLYREYVRHLREAWYAHKMYVWTNLLFTIGHLVTFYGQYSSTLKVMAILRSILVLALIIMQLNTSKKPSFVKLSILGDATYYHTTEMPAKDSNGTL
jgi:hypothetical protein